MNYLTNLFASSDLIGNVTNLISNGANLNNPVVLRVRDCALRKTFALPYRK